MIKIVLITKSHPEEIRKFTSDSIVIGNVNSPSAHLKIAEDLADHHLIISKQLGETTHYSITNQAHDPFATLNGLPFGKRPLQNGDIIQLGFTTLRFEVEKVIETPPPLKPTPPEIDPIDIDALFKEVEALGSRAADKQIEQPLVTPPQPPCTSDESPPHLPSNSSFATIQPSFHTNDLNSTHTQNSEQIVLPIKQTSEPLFNQLYKEKQLSHLPEAQHLPSTSHPIERSQKLSLKDYYLSEYDEDEESGGNQSKTDKAKITSQIPAEKSPIWSKPFKIIGSFLSVGLVLLFLAFIWVYDRSDDAEIKAARGVSDVAMALTYADIKNIYPQNQNWSDPEFIKNNLRSVLAPEYQSFADFDHHGQFTNSPYTLRIYTSSDLTQFLVIAQPSPSIIQWLVPKAPLIIDSRSMEIRRFKDLKTLNRLLVNANMNDGTHADEISVLVKHGELVPLSYLAEKKESYGFNPPKALSMIRPQAENLVYNAPRYYPLGQNLISKAVNIVEKAASNHEVAMFHQELSLLFDYDNLVIYSHEWLKNALEAQKALTLLAPKEKFLMAYLQITPQNKITGSHLLMDAASTEVAMNSPLDLQKDETDSSNISNTFKHLQECAISPTVYRVDQRDPLYIRLSALTSNRQEILKPIAEEMIAQLTKQSQTWQPQFVSRYMKLQEQYLKANEDQYRKINSDLGAIARDMSYIPACRFVEFVKAADLQTQFQDYLITIKQKPLPGRATPEEIETQLKQIELSQTWNELEQYTQGLSKVLNFDNVPDDDALITYQNTARTRVIQKLNQFLLSRNEDALPADAFMPEFRQVLVNILESAWIIDPETHHFYLAEFDHRSAPMRALRY